MMNRRHFLALTTFTAAGLFVSPVQAAMRGKSERLLSLYNIHSGEHVKMAYWQDGHYLPKALATFNHLLRDHRTNEVTRMDPRLLDVLCVLQNKLRSRDPFHVVCGYRSPETNAMRAAMSDGVAKNSYHVEGKAIDIRLPSMPVGRISKAAVGLRAGGVGTYRADNFVHVDVGPVRYW